MYNEGRKNLTGLAKLDYIYIMTLSGWSLQKLLRNVLKKGSTPSIIFMHLIFDNSFPRQKRSLNGSNGIQTVPYVLSCIQPKETSEVQTLTSLISVIFT